MDSRNLKRMGLQLLLFLLISTFLPLTIISLLYYDSFVVILSGFIILSIFFLLFTIVSYYIAKTEKLITKFSYLLTGIFGIGLFYGCIVVILLLISFVLGTIPTA